MNPSNQTFTKSLLNWYGNYSNCTIVSIGGSPYWQPVGKINKRREVMTLFKVYVVDRRAGVLTSEHTLVGSDEADAALALTLTDEELKLKKRDDLDIIWQQVGTFEKRVIKSVRMEKEED